ncbi:MAG: hypothetical protein U9N19_08820 [Thermodesulfobacteriota bacterium]|nr:hypothetical protein [Thermodesulfobacteriota bacterium]
MISSKFDENAYNLHRSYTDVKKETVSLPLFYRSGEAAFHKIAQAILFAIKRPVIIKIFDFDLSLSGFQSFFQIPFCVFQKEGDDAILKIL